VGGGRPPPGGAPPPKKKVYNGKWYSLQAPLASGKGEVGSSSGLGLSEKHFARSSLLAELREIFSLEKV
jgi:hypothetical protein